MRIFFIFLDLIFSKKFIITLKPQFNKNKSSIKEFKTFLEAENINYRQFKLGYIVDVNFELLKKIRKNELVDTVEKDGEMTLQYKYLYNTHNIDYNKYNNINNLINNNEKIFDQHSALWNLSRLSSGKLSSPTHKFRYPSSMGKDVKVFVIDTGINLRHPEYEGRAYFGANFINKNNDDENGHGTHCAGIIAGRSVGVAKKSEIISVKVLDALGRGETSSVILGVDYVISKFEEESEKRIGRKGLKKLEKYIKFLLRKEEYVSVKSLKDKIEKIAENESVMPKFVVNMSIGGAKSKALDMMIAYGTSLGITFVVAAGNEDTNACLTSPAGNTLAITVGASDKNDIEAVFSNYGKCVDIYAPGVNIRSSFLENTYKELSGTSMASPHVAGAAALLLSEEYLDPVELKRKLKNMAYPIIKMKEKEKRYKVLGFLREERQGMLMLSIRKFLRELFFSN